MSASNVWPALMEQVIVLDLASPYVMIGTLTAVDELFLTLTDADCHDLRDSKSTRELYVLQTRRHGVRCNRQRLCVRQEEIVSLSRLDEVVE